jgi:hypothetical protein
MGHVYGHLSHHNCDNGLAVGGVIAVARAGCAKEWIDNQKTNLAAAWLSEPDGLSNSVFPTGGSVFFCLYQKKSPDRFIFPIDCRQGFFRRLFG